MFAEYEISRVIDFHYASESKSENVDYEAIKHDMLRLFNINVNPTSSKEESEAQVKQAMLERFSELEKSYSYLFKQILLRTIDDLWTKHLHALECLRQSVSLRSYAQKDPLNEYKQEGFIIFENLLESFRSHSLMFIFHMEVNVDVVDSAPLEIE